MYKDSEVRQGKTSEIGRSSLVEIDEGSENKGKRWMVAIEWW